MTSARLADAQPIIRSFIFAHIISNSRTSRSSHLSLPSGFGAIMSKNVVVASFVVSLVMDVFRIFWLFHGKLC